MQRKFKTFQDALTAPARPVAANDKKPAAKQPSPRYRGTLPLLRWLHDHYPEMAFAVAEALPKPDTHWVPDAIDNDQEIRPTVGELLKAASDAFRVYVRNGIRHVGSGLVRVPRGAGATYKSDEWIYLGTLKFNRGALTEWGTTKKGKKLQPADRITSGVAEKTSKRNPWRYLKTRPTTSSPLHVAPLLRNMSGLPALPPMYDPQKGVEANRAILAEAYSRSPEVVVAKCPTAVARGAEFLGGVVGSSGTASSGALMWEAPEERKGEARVVLEEIAARGTLKSLGERLGYTGSYADRAGRAALIETARILVAANDNRQKKVAA